MANGKIAGLLAVLLGVVAALGIGLVAAQNSGVEVRIEARRLADGRVEFALRERGGERILPRARYFPAETEAGRWLNASWITVGEGREFAAAPTPTPTPTPTATPYAENNTVTVTGMNCSTRSYGAPFVEIQFTPKVTGSIKFTAYVEIAGRRYYASGYDWDATAGVPSFVEVIFGNAPENPATFLCQVVSTTLQ